ncbi:MAG: RsmB/NOP family class I SAM-dependent RNA methyltransferase, partial [Planctomycetes bacterium]|nr:RsmB/NOP family class I SAM-dependent RNA methyltransferase [Planctomycetota bacterium]
MSRRKQKPPPLDEVTGMLGGVEVPGDLQAFVRAMHEPHGNILRRRREIPPEDLPMPTEPIPWYKLGLRPTVSSPKPSRTLAYAAADYFVQDAGSLLALSAARADDTLLDGPLICDLCAAPGGKASALVEAVEACSGRMPGAFVLANEVIRSRLGPLSLNLARTGSDRYAISSLDPESLASQLPGVFDVVLVDAPCSGQTLLARGKQTRSSLSTHQIEHNASRQRRILDAAVALLRDGGILVYSTCTFAEAENEKQVKRLVDQGQASPHPRAALEGYRSEEACYRLWPHLHRCAGAFTAVLQIHGGSASSRIPRRPASGVKSPVDLNPWFGSIDSEIRLWQSDSILMGWPSEVPDWVELVAVAGPELAHRTGQTWKPAHAAALRRVDRGRAPR